MYVTLFQFYTKKVLQYNRFIAGVEKEWKDPSKIVLLLVPRCDDDCGKTLESCRVSAQATAVASRRTISSLFYGGGVAHIYIYILL